MGMSATAKIVLGVQVEKEWDDMSDDEQEAAQEAMDDEWSVDDGTVGAINETTYDDENETFIVGVEMASTSWDGPEEIDLRTLLDCMSKADTLLGVNAFCAKHKLRKLNSDVRTYLIANYA